MEAPHEEYMIHSKRLESVEKVIFKIAERISLDSLSLKSELAGLLSSKYYCFPVRHHSLAASFHMLKALEQRKPKIIFIEMTKEAQDLIPYMIDNDTKPPIAVFGFYKDNNNNLGLNGILTASADIPAKFHAWYPFLSYSPELVALKYASEMKIPVYFIDLPYITLLKKLIEKGNSDLKDREDSVEEIDVAASLDAENTFIENLFIQQINRMFGTNDLDEIWDILFEIGTESMDFEDYRSIILMFCACLRKATDPIALDLDGIHEREQFMKFVIDEKMRVHRISAKDAFIVVGGMHAVEIPNITLTQAQMKDQQAIYNKPVEMDHSLVPFSFKRFSNLYGYQSGIKSPQFAQKVWEKFKDKKTTTHPWNKN